jgi:hypothetical protein
MERELDPAQLNELLAEAGKLRNQLRRDERRLDDLVQAVLDEVWQADVPGAKPDPEAEDAYRSAARELWQSIDHEFKRLEAFNAVASERKPI